jgi:FtsZ-binding cell division protein ZapB
VNWSKGKKTFLDEVVVVPFVEGDGPRTAGLVKAMSHISLKVGEIKKLKGDIEKLKQEMQAKDERIDKFKKENQDLQENMDKSKIRLRGRGLL